MVMLGNGLSGILMNMLKGLLMLVLPGTEHQFTVAIIFFSLTSLFLLICAFSYSVLVKRDFYIYYMKLSEVARNQKGMMQVVLAEDTDDEIKSEHKKLINERPSTNEQLSFGMFLS
jgi:hypothetical protein